MGFSFRSPRTASSSTFHLLVCAFDISSRYIAVTYCRDEERPVNSPGTARSGTRGDTKGAHRSSAIFLVPLQNLRRTMSATMPTVDYRMARRAVLLELRRGPR